MKNKHPIILQAVKLRLERLLLPVFIVGLILTGCSSGMDINRMAVPDYSSEDLNVETDFQIFHTTLDSSRLFIKINTKNLLYTRGSSSGFSARVQVIITPYILGDDSAIKLKGKTIQINDEDADKSVKQLLAATDLYLPDGKEYSISMKITDLNRKRDITKFFLSEKKFPHSRQYFMAAESDVTIPMFSDRITSGKAYIIKTNAAKSGKVYVRYYQREFSLPPPPFAYYDPPSFNYEPDSVFTMELNSKNEFRMVAGDRGFYHFQADPEQKQGFTLFTGSEDHPEVTVVDQLVEPFRYLVSSREFSSVIKGEEKKRIIEDFWMEWCGNKERARSAIEAYYLRVEEANKHFSSHVDGWKSDRGLVYIVYGKPNKVYRSSSVETWIYGEENNPMSITFNFIKVINPFTVNDFRLNREDYYKPTWYRSLEAWRNGRVY
ncbi:MAG: GWxTD domain-containing protein [Cryomorphaceae bacterium]|nr:GWxTD domain-containing protein [Flavobacteriales bacterium]